MQSLKRTSSFQKEQRPLFFYGTESGLYLPFITVKQTLLKISSQASDVFALYPEKHCFVSVVGKNWKDSHRLLNYLLNLEGGPSEADPCESQVIL